MQQLYITMILGFVVSMASAQIPDSKNENLDRLHNAIEIQQLVVNEENAEVQAAQHALASTKSPLEAILAAAKADQAYKQKAAQAAVKAMTTPASKTLKQVLDMQSGRINQKQTSIDKQNAILHSIQSSVKKGDNSRIVALQAAVAAQQFDRDQQHKKPMLQQQKQSAATATATAAATAAPAVVA